MLKVFEKEELSTSAGCTANILQILITAYRADRRGRTPRCRRLSSRRLRRDADRNSSPSSFLSQLTGLHMKPPPLAVKQRSNIFVPSHLLLQPPAETPPTSARPSLGRETGASIFMARSLKSDQMTTHRCALRTPPPHCHQQGVGGTSYTSSSEEHKQTLREATSFFFFFFSAINPTG